MKVTVLGIKAERETGFEVDDEIPVHRAEVWERIRAGTGRRRAAFQSYDGKEGIKCGPRFSACRLLIGIPRDAWQATGSFSGRP